jgi:hypothetical protein
MMKKLLITLGLVANFSANAGTYAENLEKIKKEDPAFYSLYISKPSPKLIYTCGAITLEYSEYYKQNLLLTRHAGGGMVFDRDVQTLINMAQRTCSSKNANLEIDVLTFNK